MSASGSTDAVASTNRAGLVGLRPIKGQAKLIYDVGMHIATDSAYYLKRGFRVVAIEANPLLVEQATERFPEEVADGRLTIVDVGIAESPGEATFWVCDEWTAWSSFDRSIASRQGKAHHGIAVPLKTLQEIIADHGMPYYCKVDIEGNDQYCLDGLTPDARPDFLSVELSDYPFLDRMRELGYDRFKMIHQLSFVQPNERWHKLRALVPNARLQAGLERLRGLFHGKLFHGRWYFRIGSSGPPPFDSAKGWMTPEEADRLFKYARAQSASGKFTLLDSFDLHATDAAALAAL